jgi:prophage maintenance system killer protein
MNTGVGEIISPLTPTSKRKYEFSQDVHSTVLDKGAALFHSLTANHPFHNGNKRTAVLALDHFLLADDYVLPYRTMRYIRWQSEPLVIGKGAIA